MSSPVPCCLTSEVPAALSALHRHLQSRFAKVNSLRFRPAMLSKCQSVGAKCSVMLQEQLKEKIWKADKHCDKENVPSTAADVAACNRSTAPRTLALPPTEQTFNAANMPKDTGSGALKCCYAVLQQCCRSGAAFSTCAW